MNDTPLNGRKILVVEDDFSGRLYLNKILGLKGAVILNAANGQDAVNIVRDNSDIEIVLMDIQMPVMDGYKAIHEIRQFRPDLIVIAQTAFDIAGETRKLPGSGFTDYITKPIIADELIRKLVSYLS